MKSILNIQKYSRFYIKELRENYFEAHNHNNGKSGISGTTLFLIIVFGFLVMAIMLFFAIYSLRTIFEIVTKFDQLESKWKGIVIIIVGGLFSYFVLKHFLIFVVELIREAKLTITENGYVFKNRVFKWSRVTEGSLSEIKGKVWIEYIGSDIATVVGISFCDATLILDKYDKPEDSHDLLARIENHLQISVEYDESIKHEYPSKFSRI